MPEMKPLPAGSLAELKEYQLDPNMVGSCAERVPGKVLGCPHWKNCIFGRKGPENYGVRLMIHDASGPAGITEVEMSCYDAMRWEMNFNQNIHSKSMMEIITDKEHPEGGPGVKYVARGTKPVEKIEDGKKVTRHVKHNWPRVVSPHPRIADNAQLVGESYAADARKRMIEQRRIKMMNQSVGITDADLEMDDEHSDAS